MSQDNEFEQQTGSDEQKPEEFTTPETGESKENYEKMRCERIQKVVGEYIDQYKELCEAKGKDEADKEFDDYVADLGAGLNIAFDMVQKDYIAEDRKKFIDGLPSFAIMHFSNETHGLQQVFKETNNKIDTILGEARREEFKKIQK